MPTVPAFLRTLNQKSERATYLYEIMNFCHVILSGSPFQTTWVWLIKNRDVTTLKLVKPIIDGRHRMRRVTVYSVQALFDFTAPFSFQKPEFNRRSHKVKTK